MRVVHLDDHDGETLELRCDMFPHKVAIRWTEGEGDEQAEKEYIVDAPSRETVRGADGNNVEVACLGEDGYGLLKIDVAEVKAAAAESEREQEAAPEPEPEATPEPAADEAPAPAAKSQRQQKGRAPAAAPAADSAQPGSAEES